MTYTPDRQLTPKAPTNEICNCCDCYTEMETRHAQTISHEGEQIEICDKCFLDYEGMDEIDIEDYRKDLAEGKEMFLNSINSNK